MADIKKRIRKRTTRIDGGPGKNIFRYKKTVRVNGKKYVIERAYHDGEWYWHILHNDNLYVRAMSLKHLLPALYRDYIIPCVSW